MGILGKSLGMLKWLQLVFMVGTAFGALAGLFAGAGLGAAIGVLFAPKEGRKLREEMKEQAGHLVEDVQLKAGHLKEQINEAFAYKPNGAQMR
ncbi:MAG TPA: YtxH domain-containing protein [Oculatellaceae cyanobacterium]